MTSELSDQIKTITLIKRVVKRVVKKACGRCLAYLLASPYDLNYCPRRRVAHTGKHIVDPLHGGLHLLGRCVQRDVIDAPGHGRNEGQGQGMQHQDQHYSCHGGGQTNSRLLLQTCEWSALSAPRSDVASSSCLCVRGCVAAVAETTFGTTMLYTIPLHHPSHPFPQSPQRREEERGGEACFVVNVFPTSNWIEVSLLFLQSFFRILATFPSQKCLKCGKKACIPLVERVVFVPSPSLNETFGKTNLWPRKYTIQTCNKNIELWL